MVEDDALLQSGIKYALRRDGWFCEEASTIKQAKSWFYATDYSLVLLDLGLPDGSGLQLLPIGVSNISRR